MKVVIVRSTTLFASYLVRATDGTCRKGFLVSSDDRISESKRRLIHPVRPDSSEHYTLARYCLYKE
ncbi:hypothetical protein HMPREF1981_02350 [Bacteroides pyogenes F0041]|uniref:Uncharacterized protein n=1 Tax=Bacteroides pyogenes F0041 TaxID=1321819 RepID=U2CKB6_9BACE|nr:hypothetical protein HMPREF1981_02350 [Bacteroides pyogenes F0041]